MEFEVSNGSSTYSTTSESLVAETAEYRVYICTEKSTGRQCLLQVSTGVEHNGRMDRAAFILKQMKQKADRLEDEYAKEKANPDSMLNYDLAFPELIDTFVCKDQGDRRISILAFREIDDVRSVVPLCNITEKDGLRIDLRTSAWILGKLLKLLVFVHSEGIAIRLVNGRNALIQPDKHFVLAFDLSQALVSSPADLSAESRRLDIAGAAQAVTIALGGDTASGSIPDVEGDSQKQYADYIRQLATGRESKALRAHKKFYELVDVLWPREYYPFTTRHL
jgi:hypothetical protein